MLLKWAIVAVALFAAIFVVYAAILTAAVDIRRKGRMERPQPADAGIILGAYTDGFRPSVPLRARLRAGIELYRNGFASFLIVSGGQGENETVSESRSMKRFLVFNGVPPEVILEERQSSDTWENLRNSQRVMREHNFQSAVIVTSDYHLPRALAVAKQLDMNASGFAAWSGKNEFPYAVREVLARIQYTLKGQAALRNLGFFGKEGHH